MQLRLWVLALALVLLPVVASAQTSSPDEDLAAVRELVLHATYRDALPRVTAYLARADLDARHRAAGLEVRAIVQLALRDEAGARVTLQELYARDPGHRLEDPDASPVVQSAFARMRESATPLAAEIVDATVLSPAQRGAPEVSVRVSEHADAVQVLRISYRRAGESRWATVSLTLDESGAASSPLAVSVSGPSAYSVEYYVDALSPSLAVLGRLASAEAPLTISEPEGLAQVAEAHLDESAARVPPPSGGVETEAWFWIVIGVVVVGAGAGIGVGVVLGGQGPQDGDLGNATLPLVRF